MAAGRVRGDEWHLRNDPRRATQHGATRREWRPNVALDGRCRIEWQRAESVRTASVCLPVDTANPRDHPTRGAATRRPNGIQLGYSMRYVQRVTKLNKSVEQRWHKLALEATRASLTHPNTDGCSWSAKRHSRDGPCALTFRGETVREWLPSGSLRRVRSGCGNDS